LWVVRLLRCCPRLLWAVGKGKTQHHLLTLLPLLLLLSPAEKQAVALPDWCRKENSPLTSVLCSLLAGRQGRPQLLCHQGAETGPEPVHLTPRRNLLLCLLLLPATSDGVVPQGMLLPLQLGVCLVSRPQADRLAAAPVVVGQ
jgi:hypothetical protein